jgi:hypothetical protein
MYCLFNFHSLTLLSSVKNYSNYNRTQKNELSMCPTLFNTSLIQKGLPNVTVILQINCFNKNLHRMYSNCHSNSMYLKHWVCIGDLWSMYGGSAD